VRLVKAGDKVDSVTLSACESAKCCKSESCSQTVAADTSCPSDELAGTNDQCKGCPMMLASSADASSCCGCGNDCSCSADVEQKAREHVAALHALLVQERAKSTALANQLQIQEALAKAREEFCERLLEKEMEVVKLKAELQIAEQRNELTRRITALEAELESINTQLAKKRSESQLK
jgi:hypothetical protein